jgi:hypothetical protein
MKILPFINTTKKNFMYGILLGPVPVMLSLLLVMRRRICCAL